MFTHCLRRFGTPDHKSSDFCPILFTQNLGFNGQYKQQTTIWRSQMAE